MKVYGNRHGESGVKFYEYGEDWIRVAFTSGQVYEYTHASAGKEHIDEMKRCADEGEGLSTYISQNTRNLFEKEVS
ncbi:MAG TPA: hypothetical protein DCE42_08475 [Myxococcales bacterium]|nr:hypothetical protein [Deltaproteobacteria bacterium]HAA54780.1 hypothetical protein [Myxococcales bacterium]|tara:strand:- start:6091 stop:6318 length:228 start_codon:yes stop_codon:yes gene_type:complete